MLVDFPSSHPGCDPTGRCPRASEPKRIDASPSLVSIVTLARFLSLPTLSLALSFPSSVPWRAALYFLWALYEGPFRSFRLPFSFSSCLHASLHSLLRLLLSALSGLCDCRLNPVLNRFDSGHSFYFILSLSFYLIIPGLLSLLPSLYLISRVVLACADNHGDRVHRAVGPAFGAVDPLPCL